MTQMIKKLFDTIKSHFIISLAIVFGIVLLVFLIAFNTSDKRYGRAINKAEKAYTEQDYEKAAKQYEKAITIKQEYIAPYLGLLCAKEALGTEDIADTYEAGLEAIGNMDDDTRFLLQDEVVEYVLHESEVYADNLDARIEALNKGYEDTAGAEDISRILSECLTEEVEELRANDSYEEAIELTEKYSDKAEYNSEELLSTLKEEKAFSEAKQELLEKVDILLGGYADLYKAYVEERAEAAKESEDVSENEVSDNDNSANDVSADEEVTEDVSQNDVSENDASSADSEIIDNSPYNYDFTELFALDNSEEVFDIACSFVSDKYVHINEDGKTGVGLYTIGDKYRTETAGVAIPYYFYYGEYEGTVRSGFGITFTATGENSFVMYAGQWTDDMPNGEGIKYVISKATEDTIGYTREYKGNWKDGIAEGEITVTATESDFEGVIFTGVIRAKDGICETVPTESEEYVVLNLRTENLIAVLPSDSEGYALMLTIWKKDGELLKALENK